MKKKSALFVIAFVAIFSLGFFLAEEGVVNFGRIVLGTGNFGTDPNTTADITGQNDEYISNYTNGRWDFGSANLVTTGTLGSGAMTSSGAFVGINYGLTGVDSVKVDSAALTTDTLRLSGHTSTWIKVRAYVGTSDSVHYVKTPVSNVFYVFMAMHTDSTIVFVDGGNLKLGSGVRALDASSDVLVCWSDGTNLYEVAFASND